MSPRDFLEDDQKNTISQNMDGSPRDFLDDSSYRDNSLKSYAKDYGVGLVNSAATIAKSVPNLANMVPEHMKKILPYGKERPVDEFNAYNTFGVEDQPFYTPHGAIQTLGEISSPGGIFRKPITQAAKAAPHLTKWGASRALNRARRLAEGRDINALNVNPELIEDARQFLPNTLPYRNALEAAQHGDYNTLFGLQSDLGKSSSDYARSLFSAAERSHGRAGLQARNRLLDAIHENLQSQGHNDISSLLRQGQNDYRRYMAFRPYRNMLGLAALGMVLPKNSLVNFVSKILSHGTQQQ